MSENDEVIEAEIINDDSKKEKDKRMTKKESIEKLNQLSSGIAKAIKVFKIIFIVAMCALVLFGIAGIICGYTDVLSKLYEKHPSIGSGTIDLNDEIFGMVFDYRGEKTIKELYELGDLDKLCYIGGLGCFSGAISCLVSFIVLTLIKPMFEKLSTDESPFTFEMAKKIKIAFILIALLVVFNDVFIGVIVGLFLMCVYYMFIYGCHLQEEDEHTL